MNYRTALTSTDLKNGVTICIERSLSQFNDEHTVGAAGLSVKPGVRNLSLLLTWKQNLKHIYQHVGSFNINLNHCETFKAQNSNSSMTCSERRLTEVIPWSESTRRATIPGQSHLWSSAQRFPPRLWHIHLLIFDSGTQMILKLTSPKHLKCLLRRFDFNLHTAGHVHVVILILSENFRLRWSSLRR